MDVESLKFDNLDESLVFKTPNKTAIKDRRFVKVYASGPKSFSSKTNNIAKLYLPWALGIVDRSEVTINYKVTADGLTNAKLGSISLSYMKSVITRSMGGGAPIDNVRGYNVLMKQIIDATFDDGHNSLVGGATFGYGGTAATQASNNNAPQDTDAERVANLTNNKAYSHPLWGTSLSGPRFLPLFLGDGYEIEIQLDDILRSLVYDAAGSSATGDYTISDLYLNVPVINVDEPVANGMRQKAMKDGIVWRYETFEQLIEDTITSSRSYPVSFNSRFVKSVFFWQIPDTAFAVDQDTWGQAVKNGLTDYKLVINGKDYPDQPVCTKDNDDALAYNYMLASLNKLTETSTGSLAYADWVNGNFINGIDMERGATDEGSLNAFDSQGANRSSFLQLNFDSPPASATLYVYALVEKALIFRGNKMEVLY